MSIKSQNEFAKTKVKGDGSLNLNQQATFCINSELNVFCEYALHPNAVSHYWLYMLTSCPFLSCPKRHC